MERPLWNLSVKAHDRSLTWLRSAMVFSLILLAGPAMLRAATFTATLDRDTVAVGDSAVLTLTFEGGSPKNPPSPPGVQALRVNYNGVSSQFSWNNGESSSKVTYTYTLTPTQPGEFALPPIEATVGGEVLHSPPVTLKAERAGTAAPDAQNAEQQIALLKLSVPKKQLYLGEVTPIELQLYVRDGVQNIQQFQSSPFNAEGFTFGKTIQGQRRMVRIGNANFLLIPFMTTMTAAKPGTLTVQPVDCTMVLEVPGNNQRPRDAFDPFGIFNRNEAKRITLSTEAESVEVRPLPANAPADFNGAVGNFSLTMSAGPTNLSAGDPITVKIQIAGHGALDAITLPDQTAWREFKTYPPSSKLEITDQLGLQGAKNFEIVIVPQSSAINELPPLTFSYFDPEQKGYRTLKQPATGLTVRPAAASVIPMIATTTNQENPPPTQDIVPIKIRLGSTEKIRPPLVQRGSFWALQTVPVLAWAALLVRRKRAEALANNPRLRRQRAVAAIVASGLADLQRLAAEKDSDNFFATLFRLLQEQLGERLDVPASSITESVIEEKLRPRRVAEPTLTRLQDLFQACNQARYAPVKSSHELEAFIPRLESTLREIREVGK